jgi:hypothetical protein
MWGAASQIIAYATVLSYIFNIRHY